MLLLITQLKYTAKCLRPTTRTKKRQTIRGGFYGRIDPTRLRECALSRHLSAQDSFIFSLNSRVIEIYGTQGYFATRHSVFAILDDCDIPQRLLAILKGELVTDDTRYPDYIRKYASFVASHGRALLTKSVQTDRPEVMDHKQKFEKLQRNFEDLVREKNGAWVCYYKEEQAKIDALLERDNALAKVDKYRKELEEIQRKLDAVTQEKDGLRIRYEKQEQAKLDAAQERDVNLAKKIAATHREELEAVQNECIALVKAEKRRAEENDGNLRGKLFKQKRKLAETQKSLSDTRKLVENVAIEYRELRRFHEDTTCDCRRVHETGSHDVSSRRHGDSRDVSHQFCGATSRDTQRLCQ